MSRHVRSKFMPDSVIGFSAEKQCRLYAEKLAAEGGNTEEFLEFVLSLLDIPGRKKFVDSVYADVRKAGRAAHRYEECLQELNDPDDLARLIIRDIYARTGIAKKVDLQKTILSLLKTPAENEPVLNTGELAHIQEVFCLNDDEMKVVRLLYCYRHHTSFESLCDSYSFADYLRLASLVTEIPISRLKPLVGKKGRLFQSGVIDVCDTRSPVYLSLCDEVADYMAGLNEISLAQGYCKAAEGKAYPLGTFSTSEEAVRIMSSLILAPERGCNILLYGPEGTGKTEFVKALAASCGRQAYFVQYGEDGDVIDRRRALVAAANSIPGDTGLLVIDEADTFLNTGYMFFTQRRTVEKGWLNNYLDESNVKIVWITNNVRCMEGSVQRRFDYSWHFRPLTRRQRRNIWAEHLKDHPLREHLPADTVDDLAIRYRVSAAAIGSALKALRDIAPEPQTDPKKLVATLESLLRRHRDLIGGDDPNSIAALTGHYDVSALSVDVDPDRLLEAVRNLAEQGIWSEEPVRGLNLNVLFNGKPGTGKTEFAKFLAKETGLDLIIKRASDLLSPWLGMTEQFIADAFEEARRERAILFIDEADSFFTARENAHRSWEITQTNELLTQMENHSGILICCTNLLDNLDRAAMRRFHWKVRFDALSPDAKLLLYERYFASSENLQPPTPAQATRIRGISGLTPGDIKAVWQRLRFTNGAGGTTHDEIIHLLAEEVRYRETPATGNIGFRH